MNEDEIKSIFRRENKFKGCYAIDEISTIVLKKNEGLIMNTSPRHITNGHWVAFYRDSNNEFYYVDSLALPELLANPYIVTFLKMNFVNYLNMLLKPIQAPTSSMCGLFVVYFLLHLFKNVKFNIICNRFEYVNLDVNDFMLSNYFINKNM